jgi:hypothetical protein
MNAVFSSAARHVDPMTGTHDVGHALHDGTDRVIVHRHGRDGAYSRGLVRTCILSSIVTGVWRRMTATLVVLVVAATIVYAQRIENFRRYGLPEATPESFDGAFHFCRAVFRGIQGGDGGGWLTDYPDADRNLSKRLSELTKTAVSIDERTGEPRHLVVRLTAPELFHCPFIMMFEVGNLFFDEIEAAALRNYLLKGGFLWVDDFWGERAWSLWESQIRKVFPSGLYPIIDVPVDHPLFRQFRTVSRVPQIPSIDFWLGSGGGTSERGADSKVPHLRAITDERERIMVLMSHNTDFGDSYERESVNRQYFLTFSVEGYAFGINTLIYAMSH